MKENILTCSGGSGFMTKLKISLSISYLHPEQCVLPTSSPYIYTTGREMERKIVFPQFKESLLSKKNQTSPPKMSPSHLYTKHYYFP